jgi:hypothetical protein
MYLGFWNGFSSVLSKLAELSWKGEGISEIKNNEIERSTTNEDIRNLYRR